MEDTGFVMHGELDPWPSKAETAQIFQEADFGVEVGKHSVRILVCSIFSFEGFGFGEPAIECDANSTDAIPDVARVSAALAARDIRHRFELYGGPNDREELAYFHHRWPKDE